jgi:DNA-binding NtrC family response regulator
MGDGSYIPFAQDQETEEIADGVALCPFEVAMKRCIFELADRGTLFLD